MKNTTIGNTLRGIVTAIVAFATILPATMNAATTIADNPTARNSEFTKIEERKNSSPQTVDELMQLAQKAANAGDYSGSTRIYKLALQEGADSLPCMQALADNAMEMRDYAAVLELCPVIRSLDDWMPYTYGYEAQANAALGDVENAADKVVTLVYFVGIDNDAYDAMTAVADRNLRVMSSRFNAEKKIDSENPVWDECLGTIFTYARLYDQAADAYLSALKLNPNSDTDLQALALLYNQMQQYETALYYVNKAISLNPYYSPYISNKAIIMRNAGKTEDAIEMLTATMNDTSIYAPFHLDRGLLLASQGKYAEAIADYDAAMETEADATVTLLRKGIALYNLGKTQEADKVFEEVVEMGNPYWSGTALANAYLGKKNAVDKYVEYATAQRHKENHYFTLAAISDVMGNPRQALKYIDLALQSNVLNPDVLQYDQSLGAVKRLAGYKDLLLTYSR